MKTLLLSIAIISATLATAQNVNIPDANFKAYLLSNAAINTDADPSEISVAEASAFTGQINCGTMGISNLTGIEAFTALTDLRCHSNNLTALNLSNNTALTILGCAYNNIQYLNLNNNTNLTILNCAGNAIPSLDLSALTGLYSIKFSSNQLVYLNLANGNNTNVTVFEGANNPNLTCIQVDDSTNSATNWTNIDPASSFSISCSTCIVTIPDSNFKTYLVGNSAINTNGNTEIECSEASAFTGSILCLNQSITSMTGLASFTNISLINCDGNQLTSLETTNNPSLENLNCRNNQLTSLDLSHNTNLVELDFTSNQLSDIDITQNTALLSFLSSLNNLSNLNVTENINLTNLSCSGNQLTDIDISQNIDLISLACYANPLTSLNTTQNPVLSVLTFGLSQITNIDLSQNTNLSEFYGNNNNSLNSIDLSQNPALINVEFNDNSQLASVNLSNSNNTTIVWFTGTNNPNLTCIEVDDAVYSTTNWTNIDATASFSEDCSAGTSGLVKNNTLEITTYPNPTTGLLTFSTTENIEKIAIYNLMGQKVSEFINQKTIDISSLQNGVYTAKIIIGSSNPIMKRLIKN
ncbi:hypothetical protein DNU06_12135 [Putridiphycobacter roseus]|uniref:Secretion system C-terminal sorting domain-containing protein n=1 Tax=Putridiphycobacter roseus TaxID=2219161 RepID=A0A2W1NEW3_9FLAO|nr:T9SS type A sorting domain-containing protein [Putridiphycobacter roseus]PZE16596.1 hypothetical protein DNU06_12135 [Putridiphycobacter roseus]